MNRNLIMFLISIGLKQEIIAKAFLTYSPQLITDVAQYIRKRGYRYMWDGQFFKLLNEFANLTKSTDFTGIGLEGKIKTKKAKSAFDVLMGNNS